MKKFTFIVMEKPISDLPKGVIIECEAADWNEICVKKDYVGDQLDVINLNDFLQTAYCMFGHRFNPDIHTPRLLYEALLSNNSYEITLEGDIPENPLAHEDLPPEACD